MAKIWELLTALFAWLGSLRRTPGRVRRGHRRSHVVRPASRTPSSYEQSGMKKKQTKVRRFRDRRGTIYIDVGGTHHREFHPRHERKRLGISPRQQRKMRRCAPQ